MKEITHWKKRPFIYAFVTTVGFMYLSFLLNSYPTIYYIYAVLILYLVLIFELLSTRFYARELLNQFALKSHAHHDHGVHNIHQILLPSLMYFSLALFLFFVLNKAVLVAIYLFIFIVFTVIFTNIRAYYEDKFVLEEKTNNIYDIINIVLIFVASYGVLSLFNYVDQSIYLALLTLMALYLVILTITLYRYNALRTELIIYMAALILGFLVASGILLYLGASIAVISLLLGSLFYLIIAYLNHLRDDTMSVGVISEYIVVFFLFVVVIVLVL